MKNIFYLAIMLFMSITFVSCDNVEPLDPALLSSDNGNTGGGNTGGGSGGGNTGGGNTGGTGSTTADYWPTAINNVWHMERDGVLLDPIKIVGTGTFSGALYYKFAPQSGSGTSSSGSATNWLNKSNGVYKLKTDDININAGGMTGTQTGYEYIILKDNLNVGQTWNGTYSQTTTYPGIATITMNTTYTGTILAKNVTEVVDGVTYNNVIKVRMNQTVSSAGIPPTEVITEAWYAKGVGPIKSTTSSGGVNYISILVDYTLF